MPETNFKPVFEYFDNQFHDLSGHINRVESKVDKLQTSMDGLSTIVKKHEEEIVVINHRLDKLEA